MKNELRKQIIEKRKDLLRKEVIEKSNSIKEKLFSLDEFKKARVILFYASYDNEVFTHDMIKECLSVGKTVVVPISNTKNNTLSLSRLNNWDDLEIGAYGILEPKEVFEVDLESIDIVIVPGVAFDEKGKRLGHGKGYYDRLLKDFNGLSIGLGFEFQIVENVPVGKYDLPVIIIITEKRIIDCLVS